MALSPRQRILISIVILNKFSTNKKNLLQNNIQFNRNATPFADSDSLY